MATDGHVVGMSLLGLGGPNIAGYPYRGRALEASKHVSRQMEMLEWYLLRNWARNVSSIKNSRN